MAKRRFQLPGIQDLSKEQEDVRALPLEGQHLIIGGPGTGKSVMALLRARTLATEKKNYRFLIFNNLLKQFSLQLFGPQLASSQWQGWFISVYQSNCKESLPRLAKDSGKYKPFDWDKIESRCAATEADAHAELPYLIIDEGQDMPPEFYRSLAHSLGYENFFVVADQNQQIIDGKNSSRQDIETILGVDSDSVTELKINYRNSLPVARLALAFYKSHPTCPPADLPPAPKYAVKKPVLFNYRPEQFSAIMRRILIMADLNPAKLIGILCPNNRTRSKFYNALLTETPRLDHERPLITTYESGDTHSVSFGEGGIVVINAQACKGLEFDIVFIADIDQFRFEYEDKDRIKRLFYVMVARAIEHVILLRTAGERKPIDEIMPNAPEILEIT